MSEARTATTQTPPTDPTVALRAALDAAQRDNAVLRQQRDTAQTQLRGETASRFQAQETAVDNAIAQGEALATTLKKEWSTLQAEGKFEEAADVMQRMTDNSARVVAARAQKDFIGQQRQQATQQPNDPLANYSPQARAWIERNPRFLSDESFRNEVTRAHHAAVGAGKAEGSSDYFDQIERMVYPERFSNGGGTAIDTTQPQPQVANRGDRNPQTNAGDQVAGDDPFSDTGSGGDDSTAEPVIQIEDRHTIDAAAQPVTIGSNEMRLDVNADGTPVTISQEPQVRAVGRGGDGIRAVAAPPSRALNRAIATAGRTGPITLSGDEMDTAQRLMEQIEPPEKIAEIMGDANPRTAIAKWYAAHNAAPAARRVRKKLYGSEW